MAIKRVVSTDFWEDEKVEGFTPEEKYFMLFLLTNPYTKLLGVYRITKKQMSFLTGYDIDTITKLITRFEKEYDLIRYVDNEIAIKNYLIHSIVKGGKPIQDGLEANIKDVKNKSLINWVFSQVDKSKLNETVLNIINNYINTNNINVNDYVNVYVSYAGVSHHDTQTVKEIRHKHGEYKHVLLTDEQHSKLLEDLGEEKLKEYIQKVDEYCQQYGKSYKDYNLTIRKWFKKDGGVIGEKRKYYDADY